MSKTAVKQTSIFAYYQLSNLGERQTAVYRLISELGPLCNLDIARHLMVPINQVTGRTNELVAKGMVKEAFRDIYPATNRKSIYWRVA